MTGWLKRRRRGALALVAVAGMVPVTAMMSANVNTSQMIDDRRQVQDASDALATMHGAWTARALNVISMNNVTAAQLASVAVGAEALLFTTSELQFTAAMATLHITIIHLGSHCPPRSPFPANLVEAVVWTAPCTAWHLGVNVPAANAFLHAADIDRDFDPAHGLETAKKALDAIDGMNRALAARHPRAMREIAEGYRGILDIDGHHFADPCDGPGVENCRASNSSDGMALPLESALDRSVTDPSAAYVRLAAVMETGMASIDTTFGERGFGAGSGPLSAGGRDRRPHLKDHINFVTGIGDELHEFKTFYTSRISDLPRHPFSGPGSGNSPGYRPPEEPDTEDDPFDGDTMDMLDTLVEITDGAETVSRSVLSILRNLPLGYDRHPNWANLQGPQSREDRNSYIRNFRFFHGLVAAPEGRSLVPLAFDLNWSIGEGLPVLTAARMPEIFELEDISPLNYTPPTEAREMPEAFHVLAFAEKEKSRRMGEAILSTPVTSHTGYGQAGVFNPDGATLFSQNWRSRLMPATRMDDPRAAARDLDREATARFDPLADALGEVTDTSGWERVNAH